MNRSIDAGESAMRHVLVFCALFTITFTSTSRADEADIKAMVERYANAFNDKDLEMVVGFWTEGGVHVDRETGQRTEGRDRRS
jgi:hypothetical protein